VLGGVDILVNNAGIASSQTFTDLTTSEWRRILAVDLDGPFFMTRAKLAGVLPRKSGSVINIASIGARLEVAARTLPHTRRPSMDC